MTFLGLREDHPSADVYAFFKTRGRGEHSMFLEPVAGWGLVVVEAGGSRRHVGFNPERFDGRSGELVMPVALVAIQSVRPEEHCHFVSDQSYFVNMVKAGAEDRKNRHYLKANGKPFADADLWREFDTYVTEHRLRVSAGRPESDFARFRLEEASRLAERPAKNADDKLSNWGL